MSRRISNNRLERLSRRAWFHDDKEAFAELKELAVEHAAEIKMVARRDKILRLVMIEIGLNDAQAQRQAGNMQALPRDAAE